MKFAQTPMLYLIWLVPLAAALFWYGHRRRHRILKRFAKPPGLAAILPQNRSRRGTRAVLVLVAVLLVAIALAGPQYGYRWQEVERRGVDLIVALDCSRSMLAEDVKPTRLDRAKREIVDLLGMLAGDRVGLVAFAGTAFLQCPLTVDYEAFHLFLNHLGPDFLPVGGTDLAAALTVAAESFDPETATDKAVILITDGGHTGSGDLTAAVDGAKTAKIKLFCIGVGGEGGVPVPAAGGGFKKDRSGKIVLSRLDETGLKQIALATGGGYVRSVAGDMDLEAVYRQQIRKEMTARALTASRRQIWEDRYQWVLGLALLLLAVEMLLSPRRGTPRRRATDTDRRTVRRGTSARCLLPIALVAGLLLPPSPCRAAVAEAAVAEAAEAKTAVEAYQSGDYETALKGFIDAQLTDPDDPEVLYNVGNAYYKNGDFGAAGEHYQDALDKLGDAARRPDLAAKLHYNLGNARFRAGRYPQALESYEKALELAPDDAQAKENLAFVKQAMAQKPPPSQEQGGSRNEAQQSEQKDEQQPGSQDQQAGEQKDASSSSGGERQDQDSSGEKERQNGGAGDPSPEEAAEKAPGKFGEEMDAPPEGEVGQGEAQASGAGDEPGTAPAQAAGQGIDPQMAEQMLNRLEDKPGRALIPAYEGPTVEKDW